MRRGRPARQHRARPARRRRARWSRRCAPATSAGAALDVVAPRAAAGRRSVVARAQPDHHAAHVGLPVDPLGRRRDALRRQRAALGRRRAAAVARRSGAWLLIARPAPAAGYSPQLDGLRAVAVAAVAWSHWLPAWQFGLPLGAGVHLFFVLSGFLITRILLGLRDAPRPPAGDRPLLRAPGAAARSRPSTWCWAWPCGPTCRSARDTWAWHAGYLSNVYIAAEGAVAGAPQPLLVAGRRGAVLPGVAVADRDGAGALARAGSSAAPSCSGRWRALAAAWSRARRAILGAGARRQRRLARRRRVAGAAILAPAPTWSPIVGRPTAAAAALVVWVGARRCRGARHRCRRRSRCGGRSLQGLVFGWIVWHAAARLRRAARRAAAHHAVGRSRRPHQLRRVPDPRLRAGGRPRRRPRVGRRRDRCRRDRWPAPGSTPPRRWHSPR